MEKRQFRIGELSQHIGVERFVIRFWEKEFKIKQHRSQGGQRFYADTDLEFFQQIKTLLYDHGFTIAGAKQHLQSPTNTKQFLASKKTPLELSPTQKITLKPEIHDQLVMLKNKLKKLQNLI